MVYIEPQALGTDVLFQSWIQKLPDNIKNHQKILNRIKGLIEIFKEPVIR